MPRSAEIIDPEVAPAVADMLSTVAQIPSAEVKAREAGGVKGSQRFSVEAASPYQRRLTAEGHVTELRNLVASRARSAGIEADELTRLARAVLDGKARLPDGVEPAEGA